LFDIKALECLSAFASYFGTKTKKAINQRVLLLHAVNSCLKKIEGKSSGEIKLKRANPKDSSLSKVSYSHSFSC
jgi:hypothetical protein